MAQQLCQKLVRESLHDRDIAEFDDWYTYQIGHQKNGIFDVHVTFRAKNGNGIMSKSAVFCSVQHATGEDWKFIRMSNME